jgi:hypothetical protein
MMEIQGQVVVDSNCRIVELLSRLNTNIRWLRRSKS